MAPTQPLTGSYVTARSAASVAVAVIATVLIVLQCRLEQPFWGAISAWIVASTARDGLLTKAVLRCAGTAAGCAIGYAAGTVLQGVMPAQLLFMVLAAGIGTYGRHRSIYGYAVFYGGITALLMMTIAISEPGDLSTLAAVRVAEIFIGVLTATVVDLACNGAAGGRQGLTAAAVTAEAADVAGLALVASVGTAAIALAWTAVDLPSLPQTMVSSLVVLDLSPQAGRARGLQRISGCLLGGAAGLAIVLVDPGTFAWWLGALAGGIWLCARATLSAGPYAYAASQAAIALLTTMVDGPGPPDSILPPIARLCGIVLGVATMQVLAWGLAPHAAQRGA